jgi:hypothetical protein
MGNINIDLVEIEWAGVNWIALTRGKYKWRALVDAVMNL